MQEELTPNEEQILQVLRQMQPNDQMLITKKGLKADREFEIRTGQVMHLFRAEIRIDRGPLDKGL